MTDSAEGPTGVITSVFWRRVTPGDFFNIERGASAGPASGGGQLYIDIPLGSGISLQDFGNFVSDALLASDDSSWNTIEIQAYSVSAPVVTAPLTLTPRRGGNRRYRIANQNRQAIEGQRHPAWSASRGFPLAPDDVSSSTDSRMPDLSFLKIFIARTDLGEFLAGYTNADTMPTSWPQGSGLEILFERNAQVGADGIVQIATDFQLNAASLSGLVTLLSGQSNATTEGSQQRARVVRRSVATPQSRRSGAGAMIQPAAPRSDLAETISIQAPHAFEAENWVENRLRQVHGDHWVRRIGHTNLEVVPLDDGYLPGADLIIFDPETQCPVRFVEVKSASGSFPTSVRLTASELQRAKKCARADLPFDIWVVVFEESSVEASVITNFEQDAVNLTIDDLVSLDVQITA